MKIIQWIIAILALIILGYFFADKYVSKESEQQESTDSLQNVVKVMKRFDEAGKLKSDVEMLSGVEHGKAHNYYSDGSVHSVINYKHGKKEGLSTWYYENGKPYRETPFVNDKKHGVQKKYYNTGQIMAEIPYTNNELQPGTVEYNETGRPIVNDTLLSFKTIKSTSIIEITGKELKNVVNYSAFFLEKNKKIGLDGERVNGAIRFRIPSVKTEKKDIEVIVWLTLKTKMKNKSIIEKKILINMK
jgi:antitoxin component YwqK of YwqJK toxin-antitoxin module